MREERARSTDEWMNNNAFGDHFRALTPALSDVGVYKGPDGVNYRIRSPLSFVRSAMEYYGEEEAPNMKGKAWLFMLSACLIEAFLWGFTTTFGIFLNNYNEQPQFRDSRVLATIGTCASGIPFLGAPLITTAVSRWPQYQRHMIWVGTIFCVGSLLGASFAQKGWVLLLTQGIGYGIGVLILYLPMLAMANTWFTSRRGLAYGLLFAAGGSSGTGLPFLINALLTRFGFGWTLRIYALRIVVLVTPTYQFCHARSSVVRGEVRSERPRWNVLKNPALIVFALANLFQGLAFFIPALYLPRYASTFFNLSTTNVVLLLALLNASQVIAQVILGFISDSTSVFFLAPVSCLGAATCTLGLWFFDPSGPALIAFSVLFGLWTGGFTSLWARFTMALSSDKATQEFAYGVLATQRGLGNVVAGPISTVLLQLGTKMSVPQTRQAYDFVILFVVGCLVVASLGGLAGLFKPEKARKPVVRISSPSSSTTV